jgi:hypothetical protein
MPLGRFEGVTGIALTAMRRFGERRLFKGVEVFDI